MSTKRAAAIQQPAAAVGGLSADNVSTPAAPIVIGATPVAPIGASPVAFNDTIPTNQVHNAISMMVQNQKAFSNMEKQKAKATTTSKTANKPKKTATKKTSSILSIDAYKQSSDVVYTCRGPLRFHRAYIGPV